MHGQSCYPSVAFLRPQFGVFATDGDFTTRVGTFATRGGNFATKMVILLPPRSPTFRKSQVGFENPPFLSAIIDSR